MNRLAKERIIFDNYNRNFNEWKREYLEEFPEYEDMSDNYLMNVFWDEEYMDWENEMYNIEHFDNANKYILYGSIGRWNGTHRGTKIFKSIKDAINWAIEDCDYIKLYDENGHFCITCSHHDGTCCFEIKEITKEGEDYLERWEDNWNDKRSESYVNNKVVDRYSRHLNFAHKVYGCKLREYKPITKAALITKLNNQAKSFYC